MFRGLDTVKEKERLEPSTEDSVKHTKSGGNPWVGMIKVWTQDCIAAHTQAWLKGGCGCKAIG